MAPPANQRSIGNRRAQLGLFAGYLLASAGALLGALLLVVSLWRPDAFAGLRSAAADLAAPIGDAGAAGRVGGRSVLEAIAGYYDAGRRNAELEREIAVARVQLAEARALARENERLTALLGLSRRAAAPVTTARLIGSTASSARRFAYLSAGTRDGVRAGMPVTSPMGLVGRVLEVGETSARVLLLTDGESIVPVRRATDDVVAFAEGRADGSLRIRLVNLGLNPLKVGDVFVTSGAGGVFRPGIGVAMVSELTDDGAIGQLLSNPAATDVVLVEQTWKAVAAAMLEEDAGQQQDAETPGEAPSPAPAPSAPPAAPAAPTPPVATPPPSAAPGAAPAPAAAAAGVAAAGAGR